MKRFPILLNYDPSNVIGWVEITTDGIAEEVLLECAIVPGARKERPEDEYKVENFGLVPRVSVDVTEREL